MKRFKKVLRRTALIILIVIAALIPVPLLFQKKQGTFNDDHVIELVETKEEEETNVEAINLEEEFKS